MTASDHTATAKATILSKVREWEPQLLTVSRTIHANPELAFEERAAAKLLGDTLREAGFETAVGVYGLDTAIEATYGSGEFVVSICAEYDALPGVGHACGHNIIATAGVGAAIALASVADQAGITVKLIGTPAEEHGGGKVLMLERGAWEDATISLMTHGGPGADLRCGDFSSQAVDRFDVIYEGTAAHAAAAPHRGVNAADAATIAQVAIGLLRQQLLGSVRVAAYVAHGGDVTNIIPDRTVVSAEVRAFDLDVMNDAKRRVLACFEAGAVAAGCSWRQERAEPRYTNLIQEPLLASAWNESLEELGRPTVERDPNGPAGGSTDMGNVSQVVPSIHPMIGVHGSTSAPHTVGFATDAGGPEGERAAIDGAIGLAWTAAAVALNPESRKELLARQAARPAGATTVSQQDD